MVSVYIGHQQRRLAPLLIINIDTGMTLYWSDKKYFPGNSNTMTKFYAMYLLVYIQVEETPIIMAIAVSGVKFPLHEKYAWC